MKLREICLKDVIAILCIDNQNFDSDAQFHIDSYQFSPFQENFYQNRGVNFVCIREGFLEKWLLDFQRKSLEPTCIQALESCKRNGVESTTLTNKNFCFFELSAWLIQVTNNWNNIIIPEAVIHKCSIKKLIQKITGNL